MADVHPSPSIWRLAASRSRLVTALRRATADGDAKFHDHVRRRMLLCRPTTYDSPDWRAAWERTLSEIDEMRDVARARGASFAVVLLPDEYQLDEQLRASVAERFDQTLDDVVPDLIQRRMTAALSERGIPCLDLLPTFRTAADSEVLYLPGDTHFNENGNRVAAEALESWLIETFGDALERSTRDD